MVITKQKNRTIRTGLFFCLPGLVFLAALFVITDSRGWGRSDESEARAASIAEAREAAAELSRSIERVGFLLRLAPPLSRVNRAKASRILNSAARTLIRLADNPARSAALDLSRRAAFWPDPERREARAWASAVLDRTRPIHLALGFIESSRAVDPSRTKAAFDQALEIILSLNAGRRRDLGLRLLAVKAVDWDPKLAEGLAEAVQPPEIRAWTYRCLGRETGREQIRPARRLFGLARQAASLITDDEARVRVLTQIASDWAEIEPNAGAHLFLEAAGSLGAVHDQGAAAAFLGSRWGLINPDRAFEMASLVSPERPEHGAEAFLFLAASARTDRSLRPAFLEAGLGRVAEISPGRLREVSLARAAEAVVDLDWKRSLDLANMIDPAGGRYLRAEILAAVAAGAAENDPRRAWEIAERIEDPAFRFEVWLKIAGAAPDQKTRDGLLKRAREWAEKLNRDELWARLALAWSAWSAAEARAAALSIQEPLPKALALTRCATALRASGKNDAASGLWRRACKIALDASPGTGLDGAEGLLNIGGAGTEMDPGLAEKVFERAAALAEAH